MDWIDWLAVALAGWFFLSVTLALAIARMFAGAMAAAFDLSEEPSYN